MVRKAGAAQVCGNTEGEATMSDSLQTPPIDFKTTVREAVGIFASQQNLQAAIDDLLTSGFARCELSLRGAETHATAGNTPEALADDPATPRTDHFCTEALGDAEGSLVGGFAVLPALGAAWAGAAAGAGFLAIGTLTVASGGAGAVVGAALAAMLARHHAANLTGQVTKGGLLMWVRTRSPEFEARALRILSSHAATHVHSHSLAA
jgi:hypothetical protein